MIDTIDIQVRLLEQSRISSVDFSQLEFGRVYADHMFLADFEQGQWNNLQIVPYGDLSLSPATMALHYGQSIFEGMKAFRNAHNEVVLFRPEQNARRLNRSAVRICMPEIPEEIFLSGLYKLLELDQAWVSGQEGASLYIRPFMFASDAYVGLKPSQDYKFVIITGPVGTYYGGAVKVKVETHYARAAKGGMGFAKTAGNYAGSLYPAKLAQAEGYHQLVWTDSHEHKYIEESGTMNLMFVIAGTLVTPPVSDTILPGITRDSVIQIAKDWGMPVEERPVSVDEIVQAIQADNLEEMFGVGTAATVTPVELFAYQGTDYAVKPMQEDAFAYRAKQHLINLCKGQAEDTHSWIVKVA